MRKFFFIGLNKTATTTIHRYAASLGFLSWHGPKWATWTQAREREKLRRYDVFSDIGHRTFESEDLRFLIEEFPDAKFVLNTRPLVNWLVSCCNHNRIKQRSFDEATIASWVSLREEYHHRVIAFSQASQMPINPFVVRSHHSCEEELAAIFERKPTGILLASNQSMRILARRLGGVQNAENAVRAHRALVETVLGTMQIPSAQWSTLVTWRLCQAGTG